MEATAARAPAHLWILGILATLWNCFGAYDYVMTQTGDAAYLSQFSAEELAFFDSFPAWMEAFWALGVWGGLLGSVLLLARSRFAVHAFAVSLLGMVVGLGYQLTAANTPDSLKSGPMAIMPWVILAVGVVLLWYAMDQRKNGVLR